MKKHMNNKGQITLGDIPGVVLTFVFIVAVLVAGYLVLDGLGDASADASVQAAVGNGTAALDNMTTQAPTWAIILAVSVILGLILVGFGRFASGRGMF